MTSENIENIFTKGALVCILNNGIVQNPVVQVLAIKKLTMPGKIDRFVLYLSDSEYFCAYAVVQTKLNDLIFRQVNLFSIIKLKHYAISSVTDTETNITKKVVVIFDLVVVVPGEEVGCQVGSIIEVQDFQLKADACNPISAIETYEIQELLKDIELMK